MLNTVEVAARKWMTTWNWLGVHWLRKITKRRIQYCSVHSYYSSKTWNLPYVNSNSCYMNESLFKISLDVVSSLEQIIWRHHDSMTCTVCIRVSRSLMHLHSTKISARGTSCRPTIWVFMFQGAPAAFDQDIGAWGVSSANTVYRMFNRVAAFSKNLCSWDIQADNAIDTAVVRLSRENKSDIYSYIIDIVESMNQ